MTRQFDVVGLGSTSVDEILFVQSFPAPDTKTRVVRHERRCGGLTGAALVTAARLGASCAYAGRLGFDESSRLVEENFACEGIDTSYAPRAVENSVVAATIVVGLDTGTRNVFSRAAGLTGAHDELPPEEVIQNARALFVDHHGVKGALRACDIARAARIPIVADFERGEHAAFPDLLAAVDHLLISEAFARGLTGAQSPPEAVRALWHSRRSAVVVTCGARGGWFTESGHAVHSFRAPEVSAKNTAGCGDVFHGAYAAGLAFGADMMQRLELASAAAALYASHTAGNDGIPRKNEVARFLKTDGWRSALPLDERPSR
jgi:sulfofructose kinase